MDRADEARGMTRRLAVATVLVALVTAACGTNETPVIEPTPTPAEDSPTPSPAPEPEVTISEPADGATVAAGEVRVSVDVDDFDVVDKLGEAAVEGEGHVHFYLDADEIPTTPGKPAVTEEGTYHASPTTSYAWSDVEEGEHTFGVQLVNNDHTPLDPPVTAEVTVTIE